MNSVSWTKDAHKSRLRQIFGFFFIHVFSLIHIDVTKFFVVVIVVLGLWADYVRRYEWRTLWCAFDVMECGKIYIDDVQVQQAHETQ